MKIRERRMKCILPSSSMRRMRITWGERLGWSNWLAYVEIERPGAHRPREKRRNEEKGRYSRNCPTISWLIFFRCQCYKQQWSVLVFCAHDENVKSYHHLIAMSKSTCVAYITAASIFFDMKSRIINGGRSIFLSQLFNEARAGHCVGVIAAGVSNANLSKTK